MDWTEIKSDGVKGFAFYQSIAIISSLSIEGTGADSSKIQINKVKLEAWINGNMDNLAHRALLSPEAHLLAQQYATMVSGYKKWQQTRSDRKSREAFLIASNSSYFLPRLPDRLIKNRLIHKNWSI